MTNTTHHYEPIKCGSRWYPIHVMSDRTNVIHSIPFTSKQRCQDFCDRMTEASKDLPLKPYPHPYEFCACGSGLPSYIDDGGAHYCDHCEPDYDAMARDPEGLAKMRGPAYDAERYA